VSRVEDRARRDARRKRIAEWYKKEEGEIYTYRWIHTAWYKRKKYEEEEVLRSLKEGRAALQHEEDGESDGNEWEDVENDDEDDEDDGEDDDGR